MRIEKRLEFGKDARQKLLSGMEKVAKAVSSTFGPQGRNVAINQPGKPNVVHDGVTVAKSIDLEDPFEDMGAQLIKQAADNTNEVGGDGTTAATILTHALVAKGIEIIEAGADPMTLKREMEHALKLLLTALKLLSKPVATNEEMEQVASISAADPEIGKIVAEAVKKTKKDGVVIVEPGKTTETYVDHKDGMEFDKGFASPYFATNRETMEAEIKDPAILICDKPIHSIEEITPFLERVVKVTKNIVIIAEEINSHVLAMLIVNHARKQFHPLVINPPSFGTNRRDILEDIAALTGATVLTEESGKKLENLELSDLGKVEKIWCDKDKTKIIGGAGNKEERVRMLRNQIKKTEGEFNIKRLEERLAKLAGGVAEINVGAMTEVEMGEKKERVIDAVNATKAAISEGVIAGGQITLLNLSQKKIWPDTAGAKILQEAIKEPFKKLMENAGYDYAEIWGKISPIKYPVGIDVMDGKAKDMIKSGIIDPIKVIRSALENAVSVATMTFTTSVLISEFKKKKPKPGPGIPY